MIALVVMPLERSEPLLGLLSPYADLLLPCATCSQAADLLRACPDLDLVFTALTLPDGTWTDVLNSAAYLRPGAPLVVCTRPAPERLRAEVAEAGAFGLLAEPFEADEVRGLLDRLAGSTSSRRLAAAV